MSQWISVKDRLPEDTARIYIVHIKCTDGNAVTVLPGSALTAMPVTHWMPMPEPPDGDQNI